jgi:hypothetical protein
MCDSKCYLWKPKTDISICQKPRTALKGLAYIVVDLESDPMIIVGNIHEYGSRWNFSTAVFEQLAGVLFRNKCKLSRLSLFKCKMKTIALTSKSLLTAPMEKLRHQKYDWRSCRGGMSRSERISCVTSRTIWITSRYLIKSLRRWRNSAFSFYFAWIYCFLIRSLRFSAIFSTQKQRFSRANAWEEQSRAEQKIVVSNRAETSRNEPSRAEPSRAEPSRMDLNWAERNHFAPSSVRKVPCTLIVSTGFPGRHHLAIIRQEQLSWSIWNQSVHSLHISIRVHFYIILPTIVTSPKFLLYSTFSDNNSWSSIYLQSDPHEL